MNVSRHDMSQLVQDEHVDTSLEEERNQKDQSADISGRQKPDRKNSHRPDRQNPVTKQQEHEARKCDEKSDENGVLCEPERLGPVSQLAASTFALEAGPSSKRAGYRRRESVACVASTSLQRAWRRRRVLTRRQYGL